VVQNDPDPPRNILVALLNDTVFVKGELPVTTLTADRDGRPMFSTDEFDSDMPVRERHIEAEFIAINVEGRAGS
jgi:hypothetical protein